jgi:hypothetical protein
MELGPTGGTMFADQMTWEEYRDAVGHKIVSCRPAPWNSTAPTCRLMST